MNELKVSSQKILEELSTRFPGKQEFRTREVKEAAQSLGYTGKDWNPIFNAAERPSPSPLKYKIRLSLEQ